MSTALRSLGLLDVLLSTLAGPLGRAPCIHACLRHLATKPGEKSGLEPFKSLEPVLKTCVPAAVVS